MVQASQTLCRWLPSEERQAERGGGRERERVDLQAETHRDDGSNERAMDRGLINHSAAVVVLPDPTPSARAHHHHHHCRLH